MNRQDIRNKFLAILNRNDCTDDLANDFLSMAQTRIERTLRMPAMESMSITTGNSVTPTDGIVLPNDFLSLKYLYSGDALMENKDIGHFLRIRDAGQCPKYYCRVGATLLVKPSVPDGLQVVMVYYASQPALQVDTDTNIFTTIAADLLLYASLSYACDYFVDDRTQSFEGRFLSIFEDIEEQSRLTDMEQSAQQIAPAYNTDY